MAALCPRCPQNRIAGALHKKSWAVIDRPYSLGFATVGTLYERPRCIFCAKPLGGEFRGEFRSSEFMKTLLSVLSLLTVFSAAAKGATLFMGAYPDSIIVFDEAKGQVVDRIRLSTGLPTSMRLSLDRKKIYVTTNDHSGVEVLDAATHKVIN